MKRIIFLWYLFLAITIFAGCSGCSNNSGTEAVKSSGELTVVSYNAQEFFDGKKEGCEYDDYKKGGWGVEPYKVRLERLCLVMRTLKADVFVLEEIENEGILQDISNYTAGDSWRQKDLLSYSSFVKKPDTAIGIAIFSKYPLKEIKVHDLDIRSEKKTMPSMRPVLEAIVDFKGNEICLLANHWKSKSGGEEDSEVWRNWQEQVLAEIIKREMENGKKNFLVCGDFNRDIQEFSSEGGSVILGNKVRLNSPWLDGKGNFTSKIGSYFFGGSWERIDHIFYAGNLVCKSFGPEDNSIWTDSEGRPYEYRIQNGNGYSDHLPVKAVFEIR